MKQFYKEKNEDSGNCMIVSLISVPSKITEKILLETILTHVGPWATLSSGRCPWLSWREWDWTVFKIPSNPDCSMFLWLSVVPLEGCKGIMEQMEGMGHQFGFPPVTWSSRSKYSSSVSLFISCCLGGWMIRENSLFSPPTPIRLKGLYLNNGSCSPVCFASWCSSACFFIVKLITQFLHVKPSQQAAEWLSRWQDCCLGVPELTTP